jgi:hypothetical protein
VSDVDTESRDESTDELAPTAVAVLTHIVKSLVDDPDAVTVEVDDSGRRPTLNVRVGEGELGRVIGRRDAPRRASAPLPAPLRARTMSRSTSSSSTTERRS